MSRSVFLMENWEREMNIFRSLRGSIWIVLCLGLAARACADEPVIRKLPGTEGAPAITCTVYEPHSTVESKPGLVVHLYGSGGSHRKGHHNVGRSPYEEFRRLLAERGYWLVVPELGARHWMNETASAQLDSVIAAMVDIEGVDRGRVHLFGTSMGAGSSLIYAMRHPGKIKSVVAIFPMTDFSRWLEEKPAYRRPVERAHDIAPENREESLRRISPTQHVDAFRNTGLFLLHGSRDSIVDPNHSRQFVKALRDKGYSVTYREAEGETHRDEIARPYQRELADFLTKSSPGSRSN